LETSELLKEHIYPNLDVKSLLQEIIIKEKMGYYTLVCPSCGKKEAYMLKRNSSIVPYITCNRLNKCAYKISLWDYIKNRGGLNNRETLLALASFANIDIENFSYKKIYLKSSPRQNRFKAKKREVRYHELEDIDRYYKMDLLIKDFANLPEKLQFCTIVTFMYNFSLTKNQKTKTDYYANRHIFKTDDIGCLNIWDMKDLEFKLLKNFDLKSLQKFNLFRENRFKYGFSNFSVIPSFDLYSNLVTAVRFRNLRKSKIKEIEISASRIADPLPFGMTKDRLLKYNTFYFTEGHIDALSLNIENFVAVEGVNSFKKENMGYFKNKTIMIVFDQDVAGRNGAEKLCNEAKKLNIECSIVKWNKIYGKDINEILSSNNTHLINKILHKNQQ